MARSQTSRVMAKKMKNPVGYNRPGYNWESSVKRYSKTGQWNYVKDGSGHAAGERWGARISPGDENNRYSKNSPSFDEGVYESKMKRQIKLDKGFEDRD